MQRHSSFSGPDPFLYRRAPVYPEDFKPSPIEGLPAPDSRSKLLGTGSQFALQHAVAMDAVPITSKYGNTSPIQSGAWQTPTQTPPEDAFMAYAWQIDSNMETYLAYSQWIPASHGASQYQMWQSASTFGSEMPYRTQTLAPKIKTNNGLAVPHPLPGNCNPYGALNSADNGLDYNKPCQASVGIKPFSAGSGDTLVAASPTDVFNYGQMLWTQGAPPPLETPGTDYTCSHNQYYTESPGSLKGFDAYQQHNLSGSDKLRLRSPSAESDRTVAASFDSGATPLALLAPLLDIESCLFSEVAPMHVKPEDAGEYLVDEPDSIAGECEGRVHVHEGGQPKHLQQKRRHDQIMLSSPSAPAVKAKKRKKDKSSESADMPLQGTGVSVAPVKRRPGRPLSTSAQGRAIVRELAALYSRRPHDENGGSICPAASAFEFNLPVFPEVSAYAEEHDDNDPRSRDDKYVKQEDEAETPSGRTTKVAAKKHREMIKNRTKELEDLSSWMDKAVEEHERCNRRLLETVERLRLENDALLLSSASNNHHGEKEDVFEVDTHDL